mmetsp:Transcript_128037/g.362398  ORF Transcript_128037/g.362398 Transcript_128037/m.362398 type:complete len:353 (-) Transcript_128037:18-1076(-)
MHGRGIRSVLGHRFLSVAVGVAAAVLLQGCSIPQHEVGNWQAKPNYLETFRFVPPGADASRAKLNSCEDADMPPQAQCSGHGRCADWFEPTFEDAVSLEHRLSFCECDRNWAGPECTVPRKSQATAFALALFLGFFGADQFYLGYWWPAGIVKLLTFGGGGLWWIFDVVRIGSTPVVTADNFKLAADVTHWVFVLVLVGAMGVIGFAVGVWSITTQRIRKGRELLLLHDDALQSKGKFLPAPVEAAGDAGGPYAAAGGPYDADYAGPGADPGPGGADDGHAGHMAPPTSQAARPPVVQRQGPRAARPQAPASAGYQGYGSTVDSAADTRLPQRGPGVEVSVKPLAMSRVFSS